MCVLTIAQGGSGMTDADDVTMSTSSEEVGGMTNDNLPWVEKYRPSELTELISHKTIIHTITELIEKNKMPHLLLYGPPGTGKTSTILACARKINGPKYASMILELNASDDRGIDVVREQIVNFASSRKLFSSGFKLIILDEADAMTKTAQFALRRVIEKYTKSTRFCLICNYINKIIPALQSRCTRFRFGPLDSEQVQLRLDDVVSREGVKIEPSGMNAVIKLAGGDMRKCLNVMQACHLAYDVVDENTVYACTGKPLPSDVKRVLDVLLNSGFKEATMVIGNIMVDKGISLSDLVTNLHDLVLLLQCPPDVLKFILSKMSDVEYRLAADANERVQLGALIGIFQIAADMITKAGAAAA